MNSAKKHQKAKPHQADLWKKGQSGNPGGRPKKGAKNKLTMAVLAGNRPLTLDKSRPYEPWHVFIQSGIRFRRDTLERVNPKGPVPTRPERLTIREVRQGVMWKGRRYLSQRGWLFDEPPIFF